MKSQRVLLPPSPKWWARHGIWPDTKQLRVGRCLLYYSSMNEPWLRTNVRLVYAAIGPLIVIALVGATLLGLGLAGLERSVVLTTIGAALIVLSAIPGLALVLLARQPRLAFTGDHLRVNLRFGSPIFVPIELVECFLIGQGPSLLHGEKHARTKTVTLVVRLAQRAEDWQHREVNPRLGAWCGGQIIIRGTWCEPLIVEVDKRLNQRLADVQSTVASSHETQRQNYEAPAK